MNPQDAQESGSSRSEHPVEISWVKVAGAAMVSSIIALLLFILYVAIAPSVWEFGLEVETEVAQVDFQPDSRTRWRIDGATLCSRADLALPKKFRLADSRNRCGSRTWQGWQIDAPEQVIEIRGGSTALLESSGSGLSMSLRSEESSLGALSVVGLFDDVMAGDALNLVWQPNDSASISFPFSGTTTLGRAVSWSDFRMLRSGTVAVYTSDESADQRKLVDQATLMLGDQVQLAANSTDVWPKGFINLAQGSEVMQVVAFGRADSLSIERFGDSGYRYKPGYLTKLASDPWIAFWGSLLLVCMTLIPGLLPFVEGELVSKELVPDRYRFVRWLLRPKKK
ncbi:MAG: hypothetical protein ACR2PZ_26690 [Pseudomonadales bacterium]